MPKSKVREKTKRKRASANQRAQDRMLRKRSSEPDWRKRIGWGLAVAGAILFIGGNIGARTGITFLPFDPHHIYSQIGGAIVGMTGAMWALGR